MKKILLTAAVIAVTVVGCSKKGAIVPTLQPQHQGTSGLINTKDTMPNLCPKGKISKSWIYRATSLDTIWGSHDYMINDTYYVSGMFNDTFSMRIAGDFSCMGGIGWHTNKELLFDVSNGNEGYGTYFLVRTQGWGYDCKIPVYLSSQYPELLFDSEGNILLRFIKIK